MSSTGDTGSTPLDHGIDGQVERDSYYELHPEADDQPDEAESLAEAQAAIDAVASSGFAGGGVEPVDFDVPEVVACIDTETTGFSPEAGDKLITIGVVILKGQDIVAEREWLVDPGRPIPRDASQVHGIYDRHVAGKPRFPEIVGDLVGMIRGLPLVIHNSQFDMAFLQTEIMAAGHKPLDNQIIDTIELARLALDPGKKVSLDMLLKNQLKVKYEREKHGALVDARLLSLVYTWFRSMTLEMQARRRPFSPAPGAPVRPVRDLVQIPEAVMQEHDRQLPPEPSPGG